MPADHAWRNITRHGRLAGALSEELVCLRAYIIYSIIVSFFKTLNHFKKLSLLTTSFGRDGHPQVVPDVGEAKEGLENVL